MPSVRICLLGVLLTAMLLLSGCARYDVGIRFTDANQGEITQHIRLDQELPGIGGTVLKSWLETLEQQAIQLDGQVRHPSPQELSIKIPFYNAKDLQTKFNRMFSVQMRSTPNHSPIDSQLRMTTGNWIVWQRHHLQYDLDLRGLEFSGLAETTDSPSPLELELNLKTPWGAKPTPLKNVTSPRKKGKQLIWRLKPGEINHIEATFWLPSPLGIGAMLILLLVLGGGYVKKRSLDVPTRLSNF